MSRSSSFLERKNLFPIVRHADNSPTLSSWPRRVSCRDGQRRISLGLQIPFLEFLRSRAERAELVHSRTRGRESERSKRFGEHFVEVIAGCDAGADVRTEVLAGLLRNEGGHVADQERVVCGIVVRRGERANGPGLHSERDQGGNQFLLQPEQCR